MDASSGAPSAMEVEPGAASPPPSEADALKEAANAAFSAGLYTRALAGYSAALALAPSAPLYSNRAACHLKLESYGSAIADADAAQALDPAFIKAAYRRGSALFALGRVAEARREFAEVCRVQPAAADAKAKLAECVKAVRLKALAEALEVAHTRPLSETLDPSSIALPAEYAGLRLPPRDASGGGACGAASASSSSSMVYAAAAAAPPAPTPPGGAGSASASASASAAAGAGPSAGGGVPGVDEDAPSAAGVTLRFVRALMDGFRAGSADKCLHKRFCWELLLRVRPLLASYKSLVHVPWPPGAPHVNVCGDTHGQLYDTLNVFKLAGAPSPTNPFVFNGDFVDRGSFSVENVLMLFAWKLLLPDSVHLTRGNHETRNMNLMYGFSGEVKAKYDAQTMDLFAEVFQAIPLAVCVDRRVLILHGGLFQQDGVKLDEIARIDRFREPPEGGGPTGAALMSDLLWSDPQPFPGRGPSKRGVGQSFGPDVTARFLADNGLEYLIRSHEVKDDGYVVEHVSARL
jgi:serine/threonine-protein phosphatase 5